MNSKCYSTSSSLPLPSAYRDHRTAYEPGISGTSLHRSVCISTESAQESLTAAAGPAISAQILAVSRSDKRLAAPTAIPRSSSHGLDIRTRGYKRVLSSLVDAHPRQVAFVGSGAWATAAARLVARNVIEPRPDFKPIVKMWVHEERVDNRCLSELINEKHMNVKYLPGVSLPENLVASPSLKEVAEGADILVICMPHQFVPEICKQLGKVDTGRDCVAVSLTKGMHVSPEGPQLISSMIEESLGINCSVLMGANIAEEVAKDQLSEGTLGCSNADNGRLLHALFNCHNYMVTPVEDVAGVEMAGTLKNVVALGAGFVDGFDAGVNTKAVIIRRGLSEMISLSQALHPEVAVSTFMESCGAADLVASCYGGRNRRVAEAFVRATAEGSPKTFESLEAELLAGQKLQGVLTSNEVQQAIDLHKWEKDYPLFTVINAIVKGTLDPKEILRFQQASQNLQT